MNKKKHNNISDEELAAYLDRITERCNDECESDMICFSSSPDMMCGCSEPVEDEQNGIINDVDTLETVNVSLRALKLFKNKSDKKPDMPSWSRCTDRHIHLSPGVRQYGMVGFMADSLPADCCCDAESEEDDDTEDKDSVTDDK